MYDAALGACKALTVLWQARHKAIAVDTIEVAVSHDAAAERNGLYRLRTALMLGGELSDDDRAVLLAAAEKCPIHRLMTGVTTEIETVLVDR
jgi:putative redox protein